MGSDTEKQVQVFYVPFNRKGFTETLLRKSLEGINSNDYSKILYLAPTPRKTRKSKKIFHHIVKNAYIPPEMMTLKQLSKRLYSLYGTKIIASSPIMTVIISKISNRGIGFSTIINNFITEIKQYRPINDIDAIMAELKNAFQKLNVPEEGAQRAINAMEIFRQYQKLLDDNNMVDENDILRACSDLVKKHNYAPDILILDGFYELTPVEELTLKELISRAKTTIVSIPYHNNYHYVTSNYINFLNKNFKLTETVLPIEKTLIVPQYIAYAGIDEEVEGIARHIKNLFISGRHRNLEDIILTFPKLHIYSDIVQRVFKRYGIPCNFSVTKPAGKLRPFLDLIAMLESIEDDYPRIQFSQFLVSPYFREVPEMLRKIMPQISLNSGLIKGKGSWLSLSALEDGLPHEIEKELRRIFKKLEPLELIKESSTYREFCEILQRVLNGLDFTLEEMIPDTSEAYKELLDRILKELSFIDSIGIHKCGLRHFIDSFKHILNIAGVEVEGTGVQVVELFDLRDAEPEYLYMGGLKDGDLPSMPDMDHILPDNVKTMLGFVNMKRYLQLQKFIFQRLVDSSKTLHLSYPAMDADKIFLPSPFLPWKAETTEKTPGILCREEELLRTAAGQLSSHINEIRNIKTDSIRKRFGEKSFIRVTDVDNYRVCPRKFFIEKILNLEPPEIKEYRVEAMLLGTIVHKIMERLLSMPFKNFEDLRFNAEHLIEPILREQPIENYWKNFIRDSFFNILPEIYETEAMIRDDGYSFMRAEVAVEGEVIRGIRLKGKIDRIDRKIISDQRSAISNEEEIELIDYKTGTAQLNRSEVLNKGANLQLFLYAVLMKSLGFKIDRVGIYSLKGIDITWVPGKNDKREKRTIEDYIRTSLKYLEETVQRMRNGDFTAVPLSEQTCKTCHEKPYCPYMQIPA